MRVVVVVVFFFLEALQMQPHTSPASPQTHKPKSPKQPGSKENIKYSKGARFPPYEPAHARTTTHRERSGWVTESLADTGAGIRFGWLHQGDVLRPQCRAAEQRFPRQLPWPPSTSETKKLPLGVLLLLLTSLSSLSFHPSTPLLLLVLVSFLPSFSFSF